MYQPNFCAECGEQIVRERWRVWDSRRFCAACAGKFRRAHWALLLFVCAGLLGIGFFAGRAGRPAAPPLVLVRGDAQAQAASQISMRESASVGQGGPPQPAPDSGAGRLSLQESPIDPNEVVSLCGARTKKGKPCSRRVRGASRCWQHRGKSAMLPPEKLVVPND